MPRTRKPKTTHDEWGSITPTPQGDWRLRYQGPDGVRRESGRFPLCAEAEDARAQLRTSIVGGKWRATGTADSPMLADYAEACLQRMELNGQLSDGMLAQYRRHFKGLVLPDIGGIELGRVPVARLTRETVMAWDLAARAFAPARDADHAAGRNGAAQARRRGHPARARARTAGVGVPKTGRLPADVISAWEAAGSPITAAQALPAGAGDRQYEQARTALSCVCTAAVEDGYLLEHPVRMRPGTKARRRSRSDKRTIRIVTVDQLVQVAALMPVSYGLAALLSAFAACAEARRSRLLRDTSATGRTGSSPMSSSIALWSRSADDPRRSDRQNRCGDAGGSHPPPDRRTPGRPSRNDRGQ